MKRCISCRHWIATDPEEDWILHPVDTDTWKRMELPFEVRECQHPAQTFCERPVERNGFGVADGSEYKARLFTGPDFGCVRHET